MKVAKYFGATWCPPCHRFKPIMQELVSEGFVVQFFDVDQHKTEAMSYKIQSVPTVVIEESNVEINRTIGAQSKEYMKSLLS